MSYDFKFEKFDSVYDFEKKINGRAVNQHFTRREQASQTGSDYFTQTKNFEQAQELLLKGWNVQVENMVEKLKKFKRTIQVKHNRRINSICGFAPIVPNAIKGMPLSMYNTKIEKRAEHRKTVHLILNNTASCLTPSETLMKSGMTVLKLAMVLDFMGIRTKIDVIPKMSISDQSCYGCIVAIKDYKQPFNLSKMAYPLAHPSFFRRHGLKFFETMEGFTNSGMASAYGSSLINHKGERIVDDYKKFAGFMNDNVVYVDLDDVRNANFDYKRLAESKGIKLS